MSNRPVTVCQLLIELHMGGGEVLAARLARRLSGAYRFVFACLQELGTLGERLGAEGFPVYVLGKRPGIDRRAMGRLRAVLHEQRVDLVHAHHYGSFFYAAGARLPSGRPPIVLTEHGRFHPDTPHPGHALANRVLLRRRDRIVGVGESVRRALIEKEKFPARRVEVVRNGIDLAAFTGADFDRETVRREVGLDPDDFVLIQVARLDPIKDHLTGLRALARLAGRLDRARLVLVGDGPESATVERAVHDLGLDRRVLRLGLRSDVPRLLKAADVVLLTSVSEGIPLTLIEGMAAGLPVVATRVGGIPEVVADGETGLLFPAGNAEALAEQVLRLAGDPALRERLGRVGRLRALDHFSEDKMCAHYDRIYQSMLGHERPCCRAESSDRRLDRCETG
jgi:glycosyltransferase involved in cell wall biosynthesis